MATAKPATKPSKPIVLNATVVDKKTNLVEKSKPVVKKPLVKAEAKKPTLAKPSATLSSFVSEKKPKKPKLVRDSFTIPKDEYMALDVLKTRSIALAQPAKKSELLRAGILLLAGMADAQLLASLKAVTVIKTGRPKQ